jgi:tRNA U34 5-methylaminomethyl-2-thiouridine-forming methyltransferase MnmC
MVAQMWQQIDGPWLSCHSWQETSERRITAMNLTEILTILLLVAAFAGLVRYVHHDGFAASRNPKRDELGVPRRAEFLG